MSKKTELDTDRKVIKQHIEDVDKIIKDLKTMKCNISPILASQTWEGIKEIRVKHCEAYLKVLKTQEEQFAHFQ